MVPSRLYAGPRSHDPSPLLAVQRVLLTSMGAIGVTTEGDEVMDVHHPNHPASRNRGGVNAVSFTFSRHYEQIRERFGEHAADGCAGENVLIKSHHCFSLEDLGSPLAVRNAETGDLGYLANLMTAPACIEFSHYLLNGSGRPSTDDIKTNLQFLGNGRRGFYATPEVHGDTFTVSIGDTVYRSE